MSKLRRRKPPPDIATRRRSLKVKRRFHKPKSAGSSPAVATLKDDKDSGLFRYEASSYNKVWDMLYSTAMSGAYARTPKEMIIPKLVRNGQELIEEAIADFMESAMAQKYLTCTRVEYTEEAPKCFVYTMHWD